MINFDKQEEVHLCEEVFFINKIHVWNTKRSLFGEKKKGSFL